jgi:hypothetical protein
MSDFSLGVYMPDLTKLAATQAVVSSFMNDVKDLLKISISGYVEILRELPEEKRTDVVLAVIAANVTDTAAAERIAMKALDTAAVVIPAMATARMAASERSADRSDAQRKEALKEQEERELLNQIKATATKRWRD